MKSARRRAKYKRGLSALALLLTLAIGVVVVQPLWAFDVLAWLFPRVLWRVSTSERLVALSFDDGPVPDHTHQVLQILARHDARATFFLVGDRAAAYPELVDELRAGGHELGNHSFTLRSTLRATGQEFEATLARTERVLALDHAPKLFRPPGGLIRPAHLRLAEARGYRVVLGSAYPYDPSHPPSSYIRWLVTKNLEPGVIVILHDGIADPSRMLAALDSILDAGARKGVRFVSIGELVRSDTRRRAVSAI